MMRYLQLNYLPSLSNKLCYKYFVVSADTIRAEIQLVIQEVSNLSDVAKRTLIKVLIDCRKDSCVCACSLGGCNTIVMTLKQCFRSYEKTQLSAPFSFIIALFEFIEHLKPRSSCLFSDILRFFTFAVLNLSHTCCKGSRNRQKILYFHDKNDVRKIHDEEQEMLDKLEDLLVEFENEKRKLGTSTSEFLIGY